MVLKNRKATVALITGFEEPLQSALY